MVCLGAPLRFIVVAITMVVSIDFVILWDVCVEASSKNIILIGGVPVSVSVSASVSVSVFVSVSASMSVSAFVFVFVDCNLGEGMALVLLWFHFFDAVGVFRGQFC
jgi:hypothetical protein